MGMHSTHLSTVGGESVHEPSDPSSPGLGLVLHDSKSGGWGGVGWAWLVLPRNVVLL